MAPTWRPPSPSTTRSTSAAVVASARSIRVTQIDDTTSHTHATRVATTARASVARRERNAFRHTSTTSGIRNHAIVNRSLYDAFSMQSPARRRWSRSALERSASSQGYSAPISPGLTCDHLVTYTRPMTADDDRVFKALADPTRRLLLDQ